MSKKEKISLLKEVLGSSYKSNSEHLFSCPKCDHHKRKLSVNLDKNVFKCWICDYSSKGIHRLVRRFADFTTRKEWEKIDNIVDLSKLDSLDSLDSLAGIDRIKTLRRISILRKL